MKILSLQLQVKWSLCSKVVRSWNPKPFLDIPVSTFCTCTYAITAATILACKCKFCMLPLFPDKCHILRKIDHISEKFKKKYYMEKQFSFLEFKCKYWQREADGIYSEIPRGMVPPHVLALRLPRISPPCFLLQPVWIILPHHWPNTEPHNIHSNNVTAQEVKSKKTVCSTSNFVWSFSLFNSCWYAYFVFWENDLQMESLGVF